MRSQMTLSEFITKWQANTRSERAAAHEHFLDLCNLLGEPTPNSDPTGAVYAFEKGATKASGGEGWADVWRRGRFAWEYKGKHKDLEAAHRQLLQYAGALENPPLLVTSDIERIVIRTNWTNAVSERHEILLTDLVDPARLATLRAVFADPERLRPNKTRAALTAEAASDFAELAGRLRDRGNAAHIVAHFVIRLVFCLFANDVDLLPSGLFERMLDAARKAPTRFQGYASRLFGAMAARGGEVDFTPIAWFNGGLFDDDAALPLEAEDISLLQRVAALDWAEVDPSIMGTLFERGLDPDKRSQLGAHYTSRDMIERIIDPVVRHPLVVEWEGVKSSIVAEMQPARLVIDAALEKASQHAELVEEVQEVRTRLLSRSQQELFPELKRQRRVRHVATIRADLRKALEQLNIAMRNSDALYRDFLYRLRSFKVLDPACGSGNFLYLALLALKDLEHQTMVEAEALGLQREFPQVGPEAVLGIEINPYAAELARVSVWIGHIQWARRHGFPPPSEPVLQTLDTIECRDAVLSEDGTAAAWPAADAVVGNPPFLGGSELLETLGRSYRERLLAAYENTLPPISDLVCYWFENARRQIGASKAAFVGLVATDAIRNGQNRRVLDRIKEAQITFYAAWTMQPWVLEGAHLRVCMICFSKHPPTILTLDDKPVSQIATNLMIGTDTTNAGAQPENVGLSFTGMKKGGPFDIDPETARAWLIAPSNANGRSNSDVIRPWRNGMQITRRTPERWIIDFGTMSESAAAYYSLPFAHVVKRVKPVREQNRRDSRRIRWWIYSEVANGFRESVRGVDRYMATSRVSKYRVFVWLHCSIVPDDGLTLIPRSDDVVFGVLHSYWHSLWALRLLNRRGAGGDPRYASTQALDTFPFPHGLTPDLPAASYCNDPRAQAIAQAAQALVAARDHWLNPPELVVNMPEVVEGFPDRLVPKGPAAEAVLRKRTLTALYNQRGAPGGAWLDALHRDLDTAVAAAYGWPPDISDDDVLQRLLALNNARSERGSDGRS